MNIVNDIQRFRLASAKEKNKMENATKTRNLAMGILLGSLYFALTYALAPISYMSVQFRLPEGLKILSVFFGPWGAGGLLLGEMLVNLMSPISAVLDALTPWIGALPGIIIMYKLRRSLTGLIIGSLIHNVMLSVWVAGILNITFGLPFYFTWTTVFLGELGTVTFLGCPLYIMMRKLMPNIFRK